MLHHVVLWVCVERMVADFLLCIVGRGGDLREILATFLFLLSIMMLGGDGVHLRLT
jgi:hypothetical protein